MFKTTLTLVMATLCLIFSKPANAQTSKRNPGQIRPIKIGDKIPDSIWNKQFQVINHPQGKETISLKDYRNKLIILDFWATYCHPCIASLDHLDSIKNNFREQLVVIPVQVYDSPKRGLPFMQKRGWTWPSITADTTLNKILFINYLSGYGTVWIKDGKLLAVPTKKQLTRENISRIIKGKGVRFQNRTNKTIKR